MGDFEKREIDILREKIGNRSSPILPRPAIVAKTNPTVENVRKELPDAMSTSEFSAEMDLFDDDDDSDSEYGDVVPQKRKRRTNNSFANDVDDGSSDINVPPPPKRLHFTPNIEESAVLIGVWSDSPPADPAKKHVIKAFIDQANRLRQKIYPETRAGDEFQEGYPSGTGRAFVTPEFVILDSHLSSLSRQELKEYVRIRSSRSLNESPEERKKAETAAVQEARQAVAKNTALQTSGTTPSTPVSALKPTKSSTPNTPQGGIPNGVFLGFWKNSDAEKDIDKHAVFGVVDSNRMRVKVIKFTRQGRPYQGNFPINPGSNWIPFDNVVLEPALANLKRLEVLEYVRVRQIENPQGIPSASRLTVDTEAVKKAIEALNVKARSLGVTSAKLNADLEASRKAHNESRAAMKAKDAGPANDGKFETPKGRVNADKPYAQDSGATGTESARPRQTDSPRVEGTGATPSRETQSTIPKESDTAKVRDNPSVANASKNQQPDPKANASEAVARPSRTDTLEGKSKAIRSSKADSEAIAEKLRKARMAARSDVVKGPMVDKESPSVRARDEAREEIKGRSAKTAGELARQASEEKSKEVSRQIEQVKSSTSNRAQIVEEKTKEKEVDRQKQLAKEKAEAEERRKRRKEAEERAAKEKEREAAQARAEMEKIKADAIETVSNEFFSNTDSVQERAKGVSQESHKVVISPLPAPPSNGAQPSSDVKVFNNVKYVRKTTGPYAGKLVSEKGELLTIDGAEYVEYRILMKISD